MATKKKATRKLPALKLSEKTMEDLKVGDRGARKIKGGARIIGLSPTGGRRD